MKKLVIGISGKKGSGKSSVADMIERDYNFARMSFASPLKHAAMDMFDLDWTNVFGTQAEKEALIPFWANRYGDKFSCGRKILQSVGTDIVRKAMPGHWVNLAHRRIETSCNPFIVFDDLRFCDEAEMIRNIGGRLLRLDVDPQPGKVDTHESETALDQYPYFDYRIDSVIGNLEGLLKEAEDTVCDWIESADIDDSQGA